MSGTSWAVLVGLVALLAFKFYFSRPSADQLTMMQEAVADGGLLLDVRTPGEFSGNHLDGAVNIPVADLERRLPELGEKDRPVVVYCESGGRSRAAARMLLDRGFETVHDLGSWRNWK